MNEQSSLKEAYDFYGKLPLKHAIPLGLQHVLAMFVGNLTPILVITGACGIGVGSEFADLQVILLQNAMLMAGIVTLVQLYFDWSRSVEKFRLLWEPVLDLSVYLTALPPVWEAESLPMAQ